MSAQTYKTYADLLVSAHFFWTLLLIGGVIAMFVYPSYATVQIAVMSFTLLIAIPFHNTCPLTLLEEILRKKYNPSYHNDGSYIATYFNKFFRTTIAAHRVNRILAGIYILAFAIAISILILRGYGFFQN